MQRHTLWISGLSVCAVIVIVLTGSSFAAGQAEHVLHRFRMLNDGANPQAALFFMNGARYGTTYFGGYGGCSIGFGESGCGTVFAIY
jgi:hypothetical protein